MRLKFEGIGTRGRNLIVYVRVEAGGSKRPHEVVVPFSRLVMPEVIYEWNLACARALRASWEGEEDTDTPLF